MAPAACYNAALCRPEITFVVPWHNASVSKSEASMASTVHWQHRYTHPEALPGFRTPELGRQFRESAYARHGIKMPSQTPQTITVLTNVGAEQVHHEMCNAHARLGAAWCICTLFRGQYP
jgi:hypothetical protein